MEGETDDMETPQPTTGAWPAEVWLAGKEPKGEGQAEHARGNVMDKLEDVKEKLGPKVEDARDKLGPKLEQAKGKGSVSTVDHLTEKLFGKRYEVIQPS